MLLAEISKKLESRILDYKNGREEISEHIICVEIAVALTRLHLKTGRPISPEEFHWFEASYYLDYLLGGSQWEDIMNLYSELSRLVRNR